MSVDNSLCFYEEELLEMDEKFTKKLWKYGLVVQQLVCGFTIQVV